MPSVAPVAVEPRKINPPGTVTKASAPEAEHDPIETASPNPEEAVADAAAQKKPFPIIPILAGVIGAVVLGLLIKVLKAK